MRHTGNEQNRNQDWHQDQGRPRESRRPHYGAWQDGPRYDRMNSNTAGAGKRIAGAGGIRGAGAALSETQQAAGT